MDTQTVIFIGPPGSGKGTQAERLAEFLQTEDSDKKTTYFDAGKSLRQFVEETDNTSAQKIEQEMDSGDILPSFLAAYLWTDMFIAEADPDTHLVIDGSPRRLIETKLLDEALHFYNRENPVIIHLQVSEEVSYERLQKRGRSDDTQPAIAKRLRQYRGQTWPVVEWYQAKDRYRYAQIDGEQSRDEIADDIREIIKQNVSL